MTYDKQSFLAGIAVGRQLKGWAGGAGTRRGVGFYYTATGEMELVNRQSSTEVNYILLPVGTRYCTLYIPGGYMYVFAASPEPFTLRSFSNDREEAIKATGSILLGDRRFYYAFNDWYGPLPTPLVDCIDPVHGQNSPSLSNAEVIVQGILYLYGGA